MIHYISDLSSDALDVYTRYNENQLRRLYEPAPGLFIAESLYVIERAVNAGYEPVSFLIDEALLRDPALQGLTDQYPVVPVYAAPLILLNQLTGFGMTRGVLAAMRRRPLSSLEDLCAGARRIAILEEINNPTNTGAIIRSAAALQIDALILTAGCSDPLYRRAARVSMGTVFQIPWTVLSKKDQWPGPVLARLKELGFAAAAMALREDAIPVSAPALAKEKRLAILLGTEGTGLRQETIDLCDYKVIIPMSGGVDSLNVAAASAVAFYAMAGTSPVL